MSNQMWLNLKLDLLPCIAQEVEKIAKDYISKFRNNTNLRIE